MKTTFLSFVATLSLVISIHSFAGPEERMENNCFQATSSVPNGVSAEICYEGLSLNTDKNILYTGATKHLPTSLKNVELIRVTEDFFSFKAQTVLVDIWESGCREGLFVKAIIEGSASFDGSVLEDSVKIKLETEITNDTCHSHPYTEEIQFVRLK